MVNVVVWQQIAERQRRVLLESRLLRGRRPAGIGRTACST